MIRRFHSLSASLRAWSGPSSWVTPTSTHRPAPMAPTTSPSMVTEALVTRCTRARTGGEHAVELGVDERVDHGVDRGPLETRLRKQQRGEAVDGDPQHQRGQVWARPPEGPLVVGLHHVVVERAEGDRLLEVLHGA